MTIPEWVGIITGAGAAPWIGKVAVDLIKTRFFEKPQQQMTPMQIVVGDTGKRTSSSDQLRALNEATADRVQSLHKALARENPNTGGYVILESMNATNHQLERQTTILAGMEKNLENQTALLDRLVTATEGKGRPGGRYP